MRLEELLWVVLLLPCCLSAYQRKTAYLNRKSDCDQTNPKLVTKEKMFQVRVHKDAEGSEFMECEMKFIAATNGGHLCVDFDSFSYIVDNMTRTYLELIKEDGTGNDTLIKKWIPEVVRNYYPPNVLYHSEQCIDSSTIRLYLYQLDGNNQPVNQNNVHVFLSVKLMASNFRVVYMQGVLASNHSLHGGYINVFNRKRLCPLNAHETTHLVQLVGSFERNFIGHRNYICYYVERLGENSCSDIPWEMHIFANLPSSITVNKGMIECPLTQGRVSWADCTAAKRLKFIFERTDDKVRSNYELPERPESLHVVVGGYESNNIADFQREVELELSAGLWPPYQHCDRPTRAPVTARSGSRNGGGINQSSVSVGRLMLVVVLCWQNKLG